MADKTSNPINIIKYVSVPAAIVLFIGIILSNVGKNDKFQPVAGIMSLLGLFVLFVSLIAFFNKSRHLA